MNARRIVAAAIATAASGMVLLGAAGTASAATPTTHLDVKSHGRVIVAVKNSNSYPIECETWVVEPHAIGARFTIPPNSLRVRTLRGTPGYHDVWMHCGKNTLAGPDELRSPIGLVKLKKN
ncbi:hypothetical protein GII33_22150 [Gordonia pseudamarae]|jgi:hypothetical protein|uniref:Plastocyanin n=1 Tax=Gordonia pseudamarae TaxID=2831662 RepID=A0ABX6IMK2_9ACTN|nr:MULTISPECIES: hypothetical protein [Gordonia]MBD0022267.1 hypothetical protein [Gordonia sp. (in: high G+C Gram-positive bacteria)]QHN28272.1 hypothetical protein GII33_22150 [Gordonia pseudamarae]QHN37134.1 hypothetical protein GII31_21780 [Gordonia pseudamarae]